jgi:hypothetical protein
MRGRIQFESLIAQPLTAASRREDTSKGARRACPVGAGWLSDNEVEALFQALTPITRVVIAGGDRPDVTPTNLHRDELHDGSTHSV